MAAPIQPQPAPEQILGIFEQAHTVMAVSEERFDVSEQIEALDTEDPRIVAMLEALGGLSVPNLARVSQGTYLESAGVEELNAVQAFLGEKRQMAREGRPFDPAELAGLALPLYLARQDEAAEDAGGSEPLTVSRMSKSLSAAITVDQGGKKTPLEGPVMGIVDRADTKQGVLEMVPDLDSEWFGVAHYYVEPLKTSGKHEGERQVRMEAEV